MYCTREVTRDTVYIGANDRRLALFESAFPIPDGVSYNSYLISDEKTVLFDTVDKSAGSQFFENLDHALCLRQLDYVVVSHMEPDHCATLGEVVRRYPDVRIVCNKKTVAMIKQFFDFDIDSRVQIVCEGDTLCTGKHTFTFIMAPMVHWPEVMMAYDSLTKVLFSADAFGTFGAIDGNLFADEVDFTTKWLPEARRYYTNIVGKYGDQVQSVLKKAAGIEISMICPLHGPVWRRNIGWFIEKYQKWSTYTPEENAVMIAYASVYGDTQNAAEIVASRLASRGVKNIAVYDVSVTHPSVIVSEAFRCSHLVFASTTYNAGIFCNMETALRDIAAHNLQHRTVALIENGTWAPTAGSLMRQIFCSMKDMNVIEPQVTIRSSVKQSTADELEALSDTLADMIVSTPCASLHHEQKVEQNALFDLTYGLFVLCAREGSRDNGCIINTVMQLTDTPKRIGICVNKANFTHDMISRTGVFALSVLSQDVPFDIFKRFGFHSGANTDKFADFNDISRADDGLVYLNRYANSYICGKVISETDLGTHTLFIADVTEARVLSSEPSVTYAYYFSNIKPSPAPAPGVKKGFVCRICGYIYEGDTLPCDFICPLCKHGAEDFEPIGQ